MPVKKTTIPAKLISADPQRFILTFEVAFQDEFNMDDFDDILEGMNQIKPLTIEHKNKKINPITDKQMKFWYVCVRKIMTFLNIFPDKESRQMLHYELKKEYLPPVGFIELQTVRVPKVASLTDMSDEDMKKSLDKMITYYGQKGVDLSKKNSYY